MPLFEYYCRECGIRFEQIQSVKDRLKGECPRCHLSPGEVLISAFAVGGRGDLRESTQHGCHDHQHAEHPDHLED